MSRAEEIDETEVPVFNVGHVTFSALPYDLNDDVVNKWEAELEARDKRRIPFGFRVASDASTPPGSENV